MQETGNEEIDFSFKPITKGLGFHQKKKEISKSVPTTNELKSRAAALAETLDRAQKRFNGEADSMDRGALAPFYEKIEITKEVKEEFSLKAESFEDSLISMPVDASLYVRAAAWLLDILLVAFLFLATVAIIFVSTFSNFQNLLGFLFSDGLYLYFMPLLFLYYIFYFSFLEKTQFSTIGKSIFNLKVVSESQNLSLYQTFSRSIITLFNLFTLGLGSIIDFQGRMTNTKVIKNDSY